MQLLEVTDTNLSAPIDFGPLTALAQGLDWRGKLARLDTVLANVEQVEMPVTHRFSKGVYCRELFIPKDTVLTGRIHKYSQINVLLSGDISVLTESGIQRLRSPVVFESPAGAKRAGYAHEDTTWLTICGTESVNVDALEDELTVANYEEFDSWCKKLITGE